MSEKKQQQNFISVEGALKIRAAILDAIGILPTADNTEIKIPKNIFKNTIDHNYSIYRDYTAISDIVANNAFSICGIKFVEEKHKKTITLYEYIKIVDENTKKNNYEIIWSEDGGINTKYFRRTDTPPRVITLLDDEKA